MIAHQVDDSSVLALVGSGDQRAVVSLYRQHAADVYRFIARRVDGSPEDAEEILQDTMIAAVASASRFRGECSVRTWLCSIARRQILQRRRTDTRKKRIPASCTLSLDESTIDWLHAASVEEQTLPPDAVESLSMRETVRRIMEELDDSGRDLLMMRYVDEFSVREIAQLYGKSERAIEGLLRRARQRAQEIGARFQ